MHLVSELIQSSLRRSVGITDSAMLEYANQYGGQVNEVNRRLAECVRLLNRGLRSEAIQQANLRPNLIDWCAQLDFPEVEEWFDILQFFGIELPPMLNRDAVQQLQEAIVDEQPLESLLRQHRRLAIGKAPLIWRLRILRKIAKVDSTNPVWQEDIETWERARILEIKSQLDLAIQEGSYADCLALTDELRQRTWLIQPPKELVKQAISATERFEHDSQKTQLERIADTLNAAFCEQDETRARQLRAEWDAVTASLKRPASTELLQSVEPTFLWLSDLDSQAENTAEHHQAVARLEQVMQERPNLQELERAYHAARRSGFEIEEIIERRYRSLVSEIQLSNRRRVFLLSAGIASLSFVSVAAIVFWQLDAARKREIATAVDSLQQAFENGKLNEAESLLNQLADSKRHVTESAEVVALKNRLVTLQTEENERVEAFTKYVAEADNTDPTKIDLSALLKAEQIASGEAEKGIVFDIRSRFDASERAIAAEQFEAVRTEAKTLSAEISSLEANLETKLDEDFILIRNQLAALLKRYPRAGSGAESLIKTLESKVDALRNVHRTTSLTQQKEKAAMERIMSASSLDDLRLALENAVKDLPNSAKIQALKRASQESALWKNVDSWKDLSKTLAAFVEAGNVSAATGLSAKLMQAKAVLEGESFDQLAKDLEGHITKVSKRGEELDALQAELSDLLLSNLVTIESRTTSNGQAMRFFAYADYIKRLTINIERANAGSGRSERLEVVSDSAGTVITKPFYAPIKVTQQPRNFFTAIIQDLKDRRNAIIKNWEEELLKIMGQVSRAKELDSAHRIIIISRLLKTGIEGSHYLEKRLRRAMSFLDDYLSQPADWFNPVAVGITEDELPDEIQSQVIVPLASAFKERTSANDLLESAAKVEPRWVGILIRDKNDIRIELKGAVIESGKFLVATATPTAATKTTLVVIGTIQNGKPVLDTSNPELIAGRPVFFIPN